MTDQQFDHKAWSAKLLKAVTAYKAFGEEIRRVLPISGKSMDYWKEKFWIDVPHDNLTPAICRELDMEIMSLHQEATFFHAIAAAKAQWCKKTSESTFNDKFWAIIQEHKEKGGRIPGQETLKTLASIGNEDLDSAKTIADIETKFWKDILEHLALCRRLVDNASITISTELKYLEIPNKR